MQLVPSGVPIKLQHYSKTWVVSFSKETNSSALRKPRRLASGPLHAARAEDLFTRLSSFITVRGLTTLFILQF